MAIDLVALYGGGCVVNPPFARALPLNSLRAARQNGGDMDLARWIQEVTEEVMLRLRRTLHRETAAENLCLSETWR